MTPKVLKTLVCYRLLDPGSEWRLHRDWFKNSALVDLLGEDDSVAAKNTLYRCLDPLLDHKAQMFSFLEKRWNELFNASYDVLLDDLTSTYFECDPPGEADGLRRFGYSRDKRSDCVQVVIDLRGGHPVRGVPTATCPPTPFPRGLRAHDQHLMAQEGACARRPEASWIPIPISDRVRAWGETAVLHGGR